MKEEKNNFLPQIIGLICFFIGLILLIIGNFFWKSATGNPEGLEEIMWGFSLQLGGCCLLLIGTIILIIGSIKTKGALLVELE
tara:strand:- start:151 stop:399 length:249 start_codon:yes stop_codon:yes gene_type:complete